MFCVLTRRRSTLVPTSFFSIFGVSFVVAGCLYAAGGDGQRASVERYDAATNTWTAVADMLEGRHFFSGVTIGSEGPAEDQDLFDSLITKALI